MSSNDTDYVQLFLNDLTPILQAIDKRLNSWISQDSYKIPSIILDVAEDLNLTSDKDIKNIDPFVRKYIIHHPDWEITRGAGGGAQRKSIRLKKIQVAAEKRKVREQYVIDLTAKAEEINKQKAEKPAIPTPIIQTKVEDLEGNLVFEDFVLPENNSEEVSGE